MRGLFIGVVIETIVLFAPGCTEDKCKNPKVIDAPDPVSKVMKHGPGITCHAVRVCPAGGGHPDSRYMLTALEEPKFVDRGRDSWNEAGCKQALLDMFNPANDRCSFEISPETICLDVGATTGGSGPDLSGPTGGNLVTVGVSSGDFQLNGNGAGGMGGFSAEPGDGGQGGH